MHAILLWDLVNQAQLRTLYTLCTGSIVDESEQVNEFEWLNT